jgi:hypothetical protein
MIYDYFQPGIGVKLVEVLSRFSSHRKKVLFFSEFYPGKIHSNARN